MTEMVQRVARALARLEGHEDLPTLQAAYEQRARVAIEAMREPTDAMKWGRAWDECAGGTAPVFVWKEMISAALEDQPQ